MSKTRFGIMEAVIFILILQTFVVAADQGQWVITQLPSQSAHWPTINNSGEVVWAQDGGGIYSSVRGQLASSGFAPHLANSGEVVYADWFGGPYWDLVSTTRGRLTQGGIININFSIFGVNAAGEVVYVAQDTNNNAQVYSSVRGQITFGATDHYDPCINDKGEIIWQAGGEQISSTRGVLPGPFHNILELDNSDNFVSSDSLSTGSGDYTSPHIYSSAHGFVINDPNQYQWDGSINDAGTIVWDADGIIYEAQWVIVPTLSLVSEPPGFALEWSTNAEGFHAQYTTNLSMPFTWQALIGQPTTNGANFHLTIGQNLGNLALFRLSNGSP